MTERRAYYFGVRDRNHLGHFLHDEDMRTVYDPRKTGMPSVWTLGLMDGGFLKNGKVPDRDTGEVYWTCGGRDDLWFAFFWWDNGGDHRGASNSGLYVSGFVSGQHREAFEYATSRFPEIIKRQKHPLVLKG